ncbi:COG3014 family protein [Vibrio astriarenae]
MRLSLKSYSRKAVLLLATVGLVACSNLSVSNLFSHYSVANQPARNALVKGDYSAAQKSIEGRADQTMLGGFELGRVSFLNQQSDLSLTSLQRSDTLVRQWQDKPVISVSDSLSSAGALAVNDNLTDYHPRDYELGFLHLYLGLNYIYSNDLEGALVEVRRANQVQEAAKQKREKSLKSAESELKSQGIQPNLGSVLSRYPNAGKKLQAVQNGYLFYLSALLYEAERDLNSAYVDYRRALAVMPNNQAIIDGARRVAQRLGMRQDLELLEQKYGQTPTLAKGQARVIVLEERGVVEAMKGWRLDLPIYDSRDNLAIYSIALPYYTGQTQQSWPPLMVNGFSSSNDLLVDVDAMAQQALSEEILGVVTRQAIRVWLKDRIRKRTAGDDDVGNALFSVWNAVTEQPDTRSWQSLPQYVVGSELRVPAGKQTVRVDGVEYPFTVEAGRTVLVWASRHGNQPVVWHKQLGNL